MNKHRKSFIGVDSKQKKSSDDIVCEIKINKNGFSVTHDDKLFKCYNGSQLLAYLKSINLSDQQMLDLQEQIVKECLKRGMKFPNGMIDLD